MSNIGTVNLIIDVNGEALLREAQDLIDSGAIDIDDLESGISALIDIGKYVTVREMTKRELEDLRQQG